MIISLPFRPQFKDMLVGRRKTMTTRTKAMGQPGDTFEAFGCRFLLTLVKAVELSLVADHYYWEEGFSSSQGFIDIWEQIHPVKGYEPRQIVYLHEFHRVTV